MIGNDGELDSFEIFEKKILAWFGCWEMVKSDESRMAPWFGIGGLSRC